MSQRSEQVARVIVTLTVLIAWVGAAYLGVLAFALAVLCTVLGAFASLFALSRYAHEAETRYERHEWENL